MEDLSELARNELVANPPPPRELAGPALRAGRRIRRTRWLAGAGGAAALVMVAALVVPGLLTRPPQQPGARSARIAVIEVPATGPQVPATPAAALEALRYLLPSAQAGPYAGEWTGSDGFVVRTRLTTGLGTGQVTLNTTHHRAGLYAQTDPAGECAATVERGDGCSHVTLADGTKVVVLHLNGDCDATTTVTATRPDETSVTVFVPTCFTGEESGPAAPALLSEDEAVAIAVNPAFGWTMASSLVEDGAGHFPDLPGAP